MKRISAKILRAPALRVATLALVSPLLLSCSSDSGQPAQPPVASGPNLLFVMMDDVGIDQMQSFGYGGATPPPMPNITAVAEAGIKFRNTWAMPECSPSRAAFFVGRYPLRTNLYQALGPKDLANSQLTPDETTLPKLLRKANYESAMFGKFHIAGPENNEAGNKTPAQLGWDYFYGWVDGLPGSIDTTAGGVYSEGRYSCGFYPHHFVGACYYSDNTCEDMPAPKFSEDAAGLQCLTKGGIFVDHHQCGAPLPGNVTLEFNRENGHYVSPLVILDKGRLEEVPLTDKRARGLRTTIETDAAIEWINSREPGKPWMATVSYSAVHTPWQHVPKELTPISNSGLSEDVLQCDDNVAGRVIQNRMTEAMDTEFGRLLVETGLAKRADDGSLIYDPKASNTVIVIVGDNGTLSFAVKAPFSAERAKGTSYQTGVWVPLVVAGPMVKEPGREVEHMVNGVDLFQLFGELAGIDVHASVPRTVDSVSMLPYLEQPGQASLRTINFTQSGINLQANNGRNGPCVLGRTTTDAGACSLIPTSKSVCEDNTGVWWGPGYTDSDVIDNGGVGYASCWEVNQALYKGDAGPGLVSITPERTAAIRDEHYKLVKNMVLNYDPATDSSREDYSEEFYEVDQAKGKPKLEDPATNDLLKLPVMTDDARKSYETLSAKLESIMASQPECPGDGNRDGVVNQKDLVEWRRIADKWGLSSAYDFLINNMYDGLTNEADGQVIRDNMGKECPKSYGVY